MIRWFRTLVAHVWMFVLGVLRLPLSIVAFLDSMSTAASNTILLFQGDALALIKTACNALVAFSARQMLDAQGTTASHREWGRELLARVAKANHCGAFAQATAPRPMTDADRSRLGIDKVPLDGLPPKKEGSNLN